MKNHKNHILEICPSVKWIGVLDPDLRKFDIVMETKYGTTYNSYFIEAEKKAIIDTAKETFFDAYLEKLQNVCPENDLSYIIVNHTEPDHSGSLNKLLDIFPDVTIIGSGNTIRYLSDILNRDFKSLTVKDGDTLDLGNKTLRFIGAPNLHWPDTIYTYLEEDKILFTTDSFGAHFCSEAMFDDEIEHQSAEFSDAFTYYFDVILKPYSKFMIKAIEKVNALEIKTICPGHGPILRSYWKKWMDKSRLYAEEAIKLPKNNKILIAYVSAYQYTGKMAEYIKQGIIEQSSNIDVELCDIENFDAKEVEEKITGANAYLIGSTTINQNTLPQIYQFFALINPIRDKGKLAGCFGSYGWSGEAQKIISTVLPKLRLNFQEDELFLKFKPENDKKLKCIEFGKIFAEKFIKMNIT